ncbi:hypothetical protein LTR85_005298 [Meristemomyces frigidus]|nr:hypothetical protein LTR85_005298 [Meristemomyces frigidus]
MSHFPTSDQERLRPTVNGHAAFAQTPPASAGPYRPNYEWTGYNSANEQLPPTTYGYSWPTQIPHGLGLLPMPTTSTGHVYQDAMTAAQAVSMPFAWEPEFATSAQPESASFEDSRKDSWIDSCNPMSTLLPDALWDPLQQPGSSSRPYEASPSLSSYSTSSRPSAMSSSYAHSEGYGQRVGSPAVKLEDFEDPSTPRIHLLSGTAALEQSTLTGSGDAFTQSSRSVQQRVRTRFLPPYEPAAGCEQTDVKPSLRAHRPAYRKAFSSDDIHEELLEERQKRGYTKPENANCQCDQCGKLFQRSYNLKAHMETHDPHRNQTHTCEHPGCDRSFVRRTDLLRHEQSVHLKARNFPCPLCNSSFARKDTLRRHVDDGCPKRPEVKKRVSKVRRPSNAASASGARRQSFQHARDQRTAPSPLRQPAQFP